MNQTIIRKILGYVMIIEALLMVLPSIVSAFYKEHEGLAFVIVAVIEGILGAAMLIGKSKPVFYLKEGSIATALSWIVLSAFGALPFIITKEIPSFTDAMFETVSGFTTTGASILNDVESLSHATLLWRSFTHWIGGMGILVFLLALIPLASDGKGSNVNLLKAESPGPSVEKFGPKLIKTARSLYLIYGSLTLIEIIFLVAGKMNFFEAVCTAFGTAGTGGFGVKNDSIAGYSSYIQWVVTIFMILFGVNFSAYYLILAKKAKAAFKLEEVKWYFIIILLATGMIFVNAMQIYSGVCEALRHSAFQVASIITTTGFATADFNEWSSTSKVVLLVLMFVGACAGSTGGGIKVSRFVLCIKNAKKQIRSAIHPHGIQKVSMDGKLVSHDVVRATNVYMTVFILIFVVSILLVSIEDKDLITCFSAVAATINNIGPGLEIVGPTGNYSSMSCLSKWVLMFDMLAGRLELFPLLLLFSPRLWKEDIKIRRKRLMKSINK